LKFYTCKNFKESLGVKEKREEADKTTCEEQKWEEIISSKLLEA
jgi:hypothetical protein